MASINDLCQKMVEEIDGAIAAGVVDLNTGMLLGVHHNIAYFSQSYLDAVAAAAVDMFRGKGMTRVEEMLAKQRGTKNEHVMDEIQMTSKKTFHFMKIVEGKDALLVLVTKKTTNLGMGWSSVRRYIDDVKTTMP